MLVRCTQRPGHGGGSGRARRILSNPAKGADHVRQIPDHRGSARRRAARGLPSHPFTRSTRRMGEPAGARCAQPCASKAGSAGGAAGGSRMPPPQSVALSSGRFTAFPTKVFASPRTDTGSAASLCEVELTLECPVAEAVPLKLRVLDRHSVLALAAPERHATVRHVGHVATRCAGRRLVEDAAPLGARKDDHPFARPLTVSDGHGAVRHARRLHAAVSAVALFCLEPDQIVRNCRFHAYFSSAADRTTRRDSSGSRAIAWRRPNSPLNCWICSGLCRYALPSTESMYATGAMPGPVSRGSIRVNSPCITA